MTQAQKATAQAVRIYQRNVRRVVPATVKDFAYVAAVNALKPFGITEDGLTFEAAYGAAFDHILAECGE